MSRFSDDTDHVSLCEALDRVLTKGAVVFGEVTISVADIDLIYLGLQLLVSSVETARQSLSPSGRPWKEAADESGSMA
jgi:hypothetical protein